MSQATTGTNGTATLTTPGWSRGPRIRDMKPREQESVLARNNVGRVAFHGEGRIELLPIHYVYADGLIVGRTSVGSKYLNWLTRDQVVFEVDESAGLFDWKSVVVRGTLTLIRQHGLSDERRAHGRAVEAFRLLVPAAFTPHDPTPHRSVMFAIRPTEVTGRAAST